MHVKCGQAGQQGLSEEEYTHMTPSEAAQFYVEEWLEDASEDYRIVVNPLDDEALAIGDWHIDSTGVPFRIFEVQPRVRWVTMEVEYIAKDVTFQGKYLLVTLSDGNLIEALLSAFPQLKEATPSQLANFQLIGGGLGIHWPDLDEDLSVAGLVRDWASR